jgi:hypothetical protein
MQKTAKGDKHAKSGDALVCVIKLEKKMFLKKIEVREKNKKNLLR